LAPWTLGAPEIDGWFGTSGLHAAAVHEIKPARAGAASNAAAILFSLRLLARRMVALSAVQQDSAPSRILWCASSHALAECGHLYAPGLEALGIDPQRLIIVETKRQADVLWAIEEGLRSGGLAAVAGVVSDIALTPVRRLSLAAEQCRTPCLLLTSARAPSAAATATRWRIGSAPSGAHPYDRRAPGPARVAAVLERGPHHRAMTVEPIILEWSDATHCFHMATALADRAAETSQPRRCRA
jgi:protein ImuA